MIDLMEQLARLAGGIAMLVTMSVIVAGVARGLRHAPGRQVGRVPALLRSPLFYALSGGLYFGLGYLAWQPLPIELMGAARRLALASGATLTLGSVGLILWGRLALGKMYFVSTSLGAQLFSDHRLVTGGPYAWVRHPMYLGVILLGIGGTLLYHTWTFVLVFFTGLTMVLRARREDQVLAAEFGQEWQAYRARTPAFFPRLAAGPLLTRIRQSPGLEALAEVCLLFLPIIPAYLWMWPILTGAAQRRADILTHVYVLVGTLFIGLRRWSPAQLGLSRQGVGLGVGVGALAVLGRVLVILSVDWGLPAPRFSPLELAGEFIFYFVLVGFVQELLFRGLIYRAFEEALGRRWAIWGSSIAFVFWHVFGGGPLVGAALLLYGLVFALLRWRAGDIWGSVLVHGAMDFIAALMLPDLDIFALDRPQVPYPGLLILGLVLIAAVPVLLWQFDRLKKLTATFIHKGS